MMLIANEHKCVSNFNHAVKMKNRILPPSQSISSRDTHISCSETGFMFIYIGSYAQLRNGERYKRFSEKQVT